MDNNYKIEHDVPMPREMTGHSSKYSVLKYMEKGDSIIIGSGFVASLRQAARKWDIKIVTRKENNMSHRIWRAN